MTALQGTYECIYANDARYPPEFRQVTSPPECLYCMGDTSLLSADARARCLSIIGARKASPYGISVTELFAAQACKHNLIVVSGGAYGCDSCAHKAALKAKSPTMCVLGGGFEHLYPARHAQLFQDIIDNKGLLISENPPSAIPMPYMFRKRNRLIAALSKALLIAEAGMPSGTLSTADDALNMGKCVMVVPGAITSAFSKGTNYLLYQGAYPIIDTQSFTDALQSAYPFIDCADALVSKESIENAPPQHPVITAICARSATDDELLAYAQSHVSATFSYTMLMEILVSAELNGEIERLPDGRWSAKIR